MNLTQEQVQTTLSVRLSFLTGPLDAARPLAELQLDSLDTLELLMVVDELYGVRLLTLDFQGATTVGELTQLIAARTSEVAS